MDEPPPPYNPGYASTRAGVAPPTLVRQLAGLGGPASEHSARFYEAAAMYDFAFADVLVLLRNAPSAELRVETLRILCPSLLPLTVMQLMELIETVPLTETAARLRLLQFAVPAATQRPLTEEDVLRIGGAFSAGARAAAYGLVLRGPIASVSVNVTVQLLGSVPTDNALALFRHTLPFLPRPLAPATLLSLLRFMAPTAVADAVQLVLGNVEVITTFALLAELVRLADEPSGARLFTFRLLVQRLSTQCRWDNLADVVAAMNINDRLPVLHACLELNTSAPRLNIGIAVAVMACFADASPQRATCAQLLVPKFAPQLLLAEFTTLLAQLIPKLRQSVVITAAPLLEPLTASAIASVLSDVPESYNHRLDSLRALAPRLMPTVIAAVLPLLLFFENRAQRHTAIALLAPRLTDAGDSAAVSAVVSKAFSAGNERQRALELLRSGMS